MTTVNFPLYTVCTMRLTKGPFIIKWGDNQLDGVEELDLEHEVDSEEYNTLQGQTLEVDGSYRVAATITLLSSDIAALAALFPQYFVANGDVMSTGETVNNADGAIDIAAAKCDQDTVFNNLDIESCGNPGQVLRVVNARTRIEGFEIDDKLQKTMIRFIGQAEGGEATVQLFKKGTIGIVS